MRRVELKHIRFGNEVFLKTQVLRMISEEIEVLTNRLVIFYSNGFNPDQIDHIDRMIRERAEVIYRLTTA